MNTIRDIEFASTQDGHIGDVIDRINRQPSTELLDRMDFARIGSITVAVANPFEGPTMEEAVHDGEVVPIARFLPWGNGVGRHGTTFNQELQTQILADMSRRPVIAVSSPSIGSNFSLDRDDRRQVADGDFDPVSEEVHEMLDEYANQTLGRYFGRMAYLGASQGASLAINAASYGSHHGHHEPTSVLAMGLPNVLERSRTSLMQDFAKAGAPELYETFLEGGIPQLLEATNFSLQRRPGMALKFMLGSTAQALAHPVSGYALSGGMGKTKHTWERDIPELLLADTPLTLVGEGQGAIMPREALEQRAEELRQRMPPEAMGNLTLLCVKDGNHTMSDHVATVGALINASL